MEHKLRVQEYKQQLNYSKRPAHMNDVQDSPNYDYLSIYGANIEGPIDLSESETWERNWGELYNSMSR